MSSKEEKRLISSIENAVTFTTVLSELKRSASNITKKQANDIKNAIFLSLRKFQFPDDTIQCGKELSYILSIAKQFGNDILDSDCLCLAFKGRNMRCEINRQSLDLLSYTLAKVRYSFDRKVSSSERTAIVAWISKITPVYNIEKTTFLERLLNSILWWQRWTEQNNVYFSTHERPLKWLIRVHMDSFFHPPQQSLAALDRVAEVLNGCNKHVQLLLQQTMREFMRLIQSVREHSMLLFPERQYISKQSQERMHPMHQILVLHQVYDSVMAMDAHHAKQEELGAFSMAENEEEVVTIQRVLSFPYGWCRFISWFQNAPFHHIELSNSDAMLWLPLVRFSKLIINLFTRTAEKIETCDVTIHNIETIVNTPQAEVVGAFTDCGKPNAMVMANLFKEELRTFYARLQDAIKVCKKFMRKSQLYSNLLIVEENWKSYTVAEIRHFFRVEGFCEIKKKYRLQSLPEDFANALDWLLYLCDSELFESIWKEQTESIKLGCERLISASTAWKLLYEQLNTKTITFARLKQFKTILAKDEELQLLVRTADGFGKRKKPRSEVLCVEEDENEAIIEAEETNEKQEEGEEEANGQEEEETNAKEGEGEANTTQEGATTAEKQVDLDTKTESAESSSIQEEKLGKEESAVKVETIQEEEEEEDDDGKLHWVIDQLNHVILKKLSVDLYDWRHLQGIYEQLPRILMTLQCSVPFVESEALSTLEELQRAAVTLKNAFATLTWDTVKLSCYSTFEINAKKLHPCLLTLDERVMELASKSIELLEWLRTLTNDADFTSSIEIAMGRSEMECPPELWKEEEEGTPGRPDEEKLSMLRTVRAYYYPLIYRTDNLFEDAESLVEQALSKFGQSSDIILQGMQVCNTFRLPLMELLDDDSDNAAPDRLLQLMQPNRQSTWECSNKLELLSTLKDAPEASEINPSRLWLHWQISRAQKTVKQHQTLNELMDFQSSIVLSKAEGRGEESNSAIKKFIEQFNWMKELQENVTQLNYYGHFDYRSFQFSFMMSEDSDTIRQAVIQTRDALADWRAAVVKERQENYFLNFFGMNQIYSIITILEKPEEQQEEFLDEIQELLSFVEADFGLVAKNAKGILEKLRAAWKSLHSGEKLQAKQRLSIVGKALQDVLKDIPKRNRPLSILQQEDEDVYLSFGINKPGVKLVVAESTPYVIDSILTAYAIVGYLPERPEVYLCKPTTVWEDVFNLVMRWKYAAEHNRENRLYCIGAVELLSFDIQRELVLLIKRSLQKAKNPLLLISGSGNQHIVTQFSNIKVSMAPLPAKQLQLVGAILSEKYSSGVCVHTSNYPGAGKTFNIRVEGVRNSRKYVHFPIMYSTGVIARLKQLKKTLKGPAGGLFASIKSASNVLLHFDLMDTLRADFNSYLFELIFLGGLNDSLSGKQYFWNPSTTSIALEVASGALIKKLRVCSMLPNKEAIVSAENLCVTWPKLMAGMGAEFSSARFDGSFLKKQQQQQKLGESFNFDAPTPATAHERLQYVCLGLDLMEQEGGNFPYVYEEPNLDPLASLRSSQSVDMRLSQSIMQDCDDLPAARCFELLMKASELNPMRPSLWCLWNFINVFYWQLRDIHNPESPINNACMPDPNSVRSDDTEMKAKIKGEIVKFLLRTAKEFATRQTKPTEVVKKLAYCEVSGFSRPEFNGRFTTCEFENDGQPCFKSGRNLYLYYRASEKVWVIDDMVVIHGAAFCRSKTPNINGQWVMASPNWQLNRGIRVIKTHAGPPHKAHLAEGIEVSGCRDQGGSVTEEDNGRYLRQPPYDDIGGKPHYIKKRPRRHIFFDKADNSWVICPVCTKEEGAFAISQTANMLDRWKSVPPDVVENGTTFQYVYAVDEDITDTYTTDDNTVMFNDLLKWNDSNHECLLFSNHNYVVSFLSLDANKMKRRMHISLLDHLQKNNIVVGENLTELNMKHHDILAGVTEVVRSRKSAANLLGGKYCLTGDSLVKMLAIFVRIRCGIPVVLMGECGCGKTMLIRYLCAWLDVKLLVLDVHGGTTESDIINIFKEADELIEASNDNPNLKVYIFLDEINTCGHMGLLCEIVCHRSIYGKPLKDNVQVLAALNPYRKRKKLANTPGLVYQLHDKSTMAQDPMDELVYKVTPIPETLQDFIFDFGSLDADTENLYIQSMVNNKFPTAQLCERKIIVHMISVSQLYVRGKEGDASATSLRDVRRCLDLIGWFLDNFDRKQQQRKKVKSKTFPLPPATVLGLAFIYYYRLSDIKARTGYWRALIEDSWLWSKRLSRLGWKDLHKAGNMLKLLKKLQALYCRHIIIEEGIAMNEALEENLFVVIISILNKIPIFLVGKPGSSKTLTMQIISSNLQGKQSPNKFWRKYPAVYIFQYQCSPMSDSHSIKHQYDMAVRYQQHASNCITVLLLDEVGLAEHSPEMPLKILHAMLVHPPIAIVGISNWVLDPAKMNRAICLQRPEPNALDIKQTGKRIIAAYKGDATTKLNKWLDPLATAYHEVYTKQKGRDFIGMRDYYSLLKLLRRLIAVSGSSTLTPELLTFALCRNFGGKPELMDRILAAFHKHCKFSTESIPVADVTKLISSNLKDKSSRNLMILTRNGAALPLLYGCGLLSERSATVLIGSEFSEDRTELHLVSQINEVKVAMANGKTVVLVNHDNIYEALYDVLNQRYVTKTDNKTGKTKRMLRLAIGSRSQLCNVKSGFRMIVVVEQQHAYQNLDLPLLNRFEKQVLCPQQLLGKLQQNICQQITDWVNNIAAETGSRSLQDMFIGYHPETIPSAILQLSGFNDSVLEGVEVETAKIIQKALLRVTLPITFMHSETLKQFAKDTNIDYFAEHASFSTIAPQLIAEHTAKPKEQQSCGAMITILTHSPVSHLTKESCGITEQSCVFLQLSQLTSEAQLIAELQQFFNSSSTNSNGILILQADPIACPATLIQHARYVCVREQSAHLHKVEVGSAPDIQMHVIFMVHLPPGISQRARHFSLEFHKPWSYAFIDDVRSASSGDMCALDLLSLCNRSAYDLISAGVIKFEEILQKRLHSAIARVVAPSMSQDADSTINRFKAIQSMFKAPSSKSFVIDLILANLKQFNEPDDKGMHLHVRKIFTEGIHSGNLRESLEYSLQQLVIGAVANVIRVLDTNFNISSAGSFVNDDIISKLWLTLSACPAILDKEVVACTQISYAPIDGFNTSLHGPIAAKFPFSWKILAALSATDSEENLANKEVASTALLATIYGKKVAEAIQAVNSSIEEHVQYLHDFVAFTTAPFPNISFDEQLQLYYAIFRAYRADSITSIELIHSTSFACKKQIFEILSVMSNAAIPQDILQKMKKVVLSYPPNKKVTPQFGEACLRDVLVRTLRILFEGLWALLPQSTSVAMNTFTAIKSVIEPVLLSLHIQKVNFRAAKQPLKKEYNVNASWVGLILFSIAYNKAPIYSEIVPTLIQLARECNPNSKDYLLKLLLFLQSYKWGSAQSDVAHAFIRTLVFERRRTYLASTSAIDYHATNQLKLAPDLIELFIDYINEGQSCLNERSVIDISIRRTLIHEFIKSNTPFKINSLTTAQLVRQYEMDLGVAAAGKAEAQLHCNFTKDLLTTTLANVLAKDDGSCKQYLKAHALATVVLSRYAKFVAQSKNKSAIKGLYTTKVQELLDSDNQYAKCLALKYLLHYGGYQLIVELLSLEDNSQVPWLKAKVPFRTQHEVPDIYVYLQGNSLYKELVSSIAESFSTSKSPQIETRSLNSIADVQTLLLACFSQLSIDAAPKKSSIVLSELDRTIRARTPKTINMQWIAHWIACGGKLNFLSAVPMSTYRSTLFRQLTGYAAVALGCNTSPKYNYRNSSALTDFPSIFYHFLQRSDILEKLFIPTMPEDELASVILALGNVGWYKCPNGHPYSVGNCTRPMETSYCMQCGAVIGGNYHVPAARNTRVNERAIIGSRVKTGYVRYARRDPNPTIRMNTTAVYLFRFIMYSLLNLNLSHGESNNRRHIVSFLGMKSNAEAVLLVQTEMVYNWESLLAYTQLPEGHLTIAIGLVIQGMPLCHSVEQTMQWRADFESWFQGRVEQIFGSAALPEKLDAISQSIVEDNVLLKIKSSIGNEEWDMISERQFTNTVYRNRKRNVANQRDEILDPEPEIWRLRLAVSFDHFKKTLKATVWNQTAYPLLFALLEEEQRLPYIKYIVDILAWHAVIFEALQSNQLSREKARATTNAQLIAMLPVNKQQNAWTVFAKFCEAFNTAFPKLVRTLYECEPNPFVNTKTGGIDLSGTGNQSEEMCVTTPIIFSIPSMMQHGENQDATCLCTIRLLETLLRSHTEVLTKLKELNDTPKRTSPPKTATAATENNDDDDDCAQQQDDAECTIKSVQQANTNKKITACTTISYQTPSALIANKLIIYDRERDLLPLLHIFSVQLLDLGRGKQLEYDFSAIEQVIKDELLSNASEINLNIRHYQFLGEITRTGKLSALRLRIDQEMIDPAIQAAIIAEIDTDNNLNNLMAQIEVCVGFLVAVGGKNVKKIDGDILLKDYMLNTLMINEEVWEDIATTTLSQSIYLKHLQALYMCLEEAKNGDPMDEIHSKFTEPLDKKHEKLLAKAVKKFDLTLLLPVFKDFMLAQLCTPNWDADDSIKMYLEFFDERLMEYDWFATHFPDDLDLANAASIYRFLLSNYKPK